MRVTWPAWAAAVWSFLFAGLSVFWAFGGRTGLHPMETGAPFGPWSGVVQLGAAVVKAGLGVVALASMTRRSPRTLQRLLWLIAVALLVYGLYEGLGNALVVTGVLDLGRPVSRWYWYYAVLWGPYWLIGGLLFLGAARAHRSGGTATRS